MKSSDASPDSPDTGVSAVALRDVAVDWARRRAAGLSETERHELRVWLGRDPRHRAALARAEHADELDWPLYSGTTDLIVQGLARRQRQRRARRWVAGTIATAVCALAVAWWVPRTSAPDVAPSLPVAVVAPERQTLPDGSVVDLRDGAKIEIDFSQVSRRNVRLVSGTAHFEVARDPARPFVVHVGDVQVRAVGTAFTIAQQTGEVNVLVTHGRVAIDDVPLLSSPSAPSSDVAEAQRSAPSVRSLIEAGNAAVVRVAANGGRDVTVQPISSTEMDIVQAWRATRLEFSGTPLREVVAAINRHGVVQVIIADPTLETVRLSGALRADKVEALVQILEADFAIQAEPGAGGQVRLRRRADVR